MLSCLSIVRDETCNDFSARARNALERLNANNDFIVTFCQHNTLSNVRAGVAATTSLAYEADAPL